MRGVLKRRVVLEKGNLNERVVLVKGNLNKRAVLMRWCPKEKGCPSERES